MLPLWIIDLTQSPGRRGKLVSLLGQMKGVFFSDQGNDVTSGDYRWMYTYYDVNLEKASAEWKDAWNNKSIFDLSEFCANDSDKRLASFSECVYALQNRMVKDGQEYVRMIRHSSMKAYATLNVCVLGDASEDFTQLVFPSVALMLQKEKGRMLANHIHQGLSIIGALFVPSSVNSFEVGRRERLLRTLQEVDIQHNVTTVRGYDHVLLYQDVQNRVDKFYPLLDEEGCSEYLFQCLVHLYFASSTQHPLISGVAAADSFYLSMGAASVFFDDGHEESVTCSEVSSNLLQQFYAKPLNDDMFETSKEWEQKKQFVPFESISVINVLQKFKVDKITLDDELPAPNPDPIANFLNKQLKRRYYLDRLLNWVADFRRMMNDAIENATSEKLEWVHKTFNKSINVLQDVSFRDGTRRFVERCNSSDGGILLLDSQLRNLKKKAGEEKKRIVDYVERHVWENVFQCVDKQYIDAFHDYHSAYFQDISSKTSGHFCDDMKNAAIDDYCNHLKQESPILSRIARAFILGIVAVLFVLPILHFISPLFINLGDIRKTAMPWAAAVFLIPAVLELISTLRYIVKRKRKERKLRAFYLHDAYARIANRIVAESNNYYDQVMCLCDLYLQRTESIRKEIHEFPAPEKLRSTLPVTQFNQPLVDGKFCKHVLLTEESLEPQMISINHVAKDVNLLGPDDYFSLVHLFKDTFISLFSDLRLPDDKHPVDREKTTGTVRLLSDEDIAARKQKEWETIRDQFKRTLPSLVQEELVPRQHSSASSMLMQYYNRKRNGAILKPFIMYAAFNGEFVTSANREMADIKTLDDKFKTMVADYLPSDTVFQVESVGGEDEESQEMSELYRNYIFLTRWTAFESVALNRILPLEDFDIEEQKRQINEEQRDQKKKKDKDEKQQQPEDDYPVASSSVVLWSLCDGDNSFQWLKLFHSNVLVKARRFSEDIKKKLTTKD